MVFFFLVDFSICKKVRLFLFGDVDYLLNEYVSCSYNELFLNNGEIFFERNLDLSDVESDDFIDVSIGSLSGN